MNTRVSETAPAFEVKPRRGGLCIEPQTPGFSFLFLGGAARQGLGLRRCHNGRAAQKQKARAECPRFYTQATPLGFAQRQTRPGLSPFAATKTVINMGQSSRGTGALRADQVQP